MSTKTINIISRGLFLLSVTALAACGGGGGGDGSSGGPSDPNPNPPPASVEPVVLDGHAVKGPLSNAAVGVYSILTGASLKGELLADGSTEAAGAFEGIEFELDDADYYLVEVTADTDTVDISTGEAPVVTTLATLALSDALESGEPVYATVSTTLVVEMLRLNGGAESAAQFDELVDRYSATVGSELGFGLLQGVDLFRQEPLVIETKAATEALLDYRTALEAQVALIWQVSLELGQPVSRVLELMAADLLDGQYDGLTSLTAADFIEGSQQVFEVAARQVIGELIIPGTGAVRGEGAEDYLAGETAQLLLMEAAETAPGADTVALENAPSPIVLAALGPDMDADGRPDEIDEDIDGDGVLNIADAFPLDPSETLDSDSDGVGDNGDAYPTDGNCSVEEHGNGGECYLTALSAYEIDQSIAGEDGSVLLVASTEAELTLFRYVPESQGIEEKIVLAVDDVMPTSVLVHEGHTRTYIAYPDGAIRYLDGSSLRLLTNIGFPVLNLAAAGDYLFVAADDDKGTTHLTLASSGQLMYQRDYENNFLSADWSDSLGRLFFRTGTSSASRLAYLDINQSNGQFNYDYYYPYDNDYYPDGQVLVLDNVNRVLTGSGVQFKADSQDRSEFDLLPFDRAEYDGHDLVTAGTNAQGATSVKAYTRNGELYETQSFVGATSALMARENEYFLVTREASGQFHFHTFGTDRDLDDDGVENVDDHFPTDPAASLDSDGDGWPDSWNAGYSETDSTTGLTLDAYPEDSACQEVSEGNGTVCDVTNAVVIGEVEKSVLHDNIVYALSVSEQIIYRWDLMQEENLNPILLARELTGAQAVSIAVTDNGNLLVADDAGVAHRISSVQPLQSERLLQVAGRDVDLVNAGPHLLVAETTNSGYRKFNVLSSDFDRLNYFQIYNDSVDLEYHAETDRLYWNENSYDGQLRSGAISPETGYLGYTRTFRFAPPELPAFVAVSPDAGRILVGGDTVVRDMQGTPYSQQLPLSESWPALSSEFYPRDAFWWNTISTVLFQIEDNLWLAAYDAQLSKPLFSMDLGTLDGRQVLQYDEGLVYLEPDAGTGMSFRKIPLFGDADEDGIPYWWEFQFGLDDDDASDADQDLDGDGLSNLEEFIASTSATEADSDGDGLNDGDEVFVHETNPSEKDSDGDLMPDAWELAAGLDPNSAGDMAEDLDGDGYANYIEYINGTDAAEAGSVPASVSNAYFSFEDGRIPEEFVVASAPDEVAVTTDQASHGSHALVLDGSANITWQRNFSPAELSFDLVSDCYNYYSKDVSVRVNGELVYAGNPPQTAWNTQTVLMAGGKNELSISIQGTGASCSVYLDNFVVEPLKNVFEMGTSFVASNGNRIQFYDFERNLQKEVEVAGNEEYTGYARDLATLEDGRVAVFNGTFEPVLSIYAPHLHEWAHYSAPGWSTINNGSYGGIDAIGERVFVTNMSTSGSPNQGIVVFDLGDGSVEFVSGKGYIDLTVGEDGYLYAFSGGAIDKYDPDTMGLLAEITVNSGRSVAVNAAGEFFVADWNGQVTKYDQSGVEQASLDIGGSFYDISLRPNGDLLLSSRFNDLVMADTNLNSAVNLSVYAAFIDFTPHLDSDDDGLPDWWEAGNGLDPHDASDANSDYDLDNLTAAEEFVLGTRANKTDTDEDSVNDGDEVLVRGTDPLNPDSDGDGLNDGEEVAAGTDPTLMDSDGDGLTDLEEVEVYGSDPLASDSDMDGMDDLYEITYGLDVQVDDAAADADDDGLTNLEEAVIGSSPVLSDTDGDTLSDFDEYAIHDTSPLLRDSDGDIMRDDWELLVGLDPNAPGDAAEDLDSDTFSNLEEYVAHTSPSNETEFPRPIVWGTAQGGADHTGYTPWDLDESDFSLRWNKAFPDTPQLHGAAAGDGRVFVSSSSYYSNQRIYGLNAETGELLWEKAYDDISSLNAPAYDDGQVFFQTGGHGDSFVRGVDAETGALSFATSYSNQWSRYLAPTPFDGQLYMAGGYYGGMYSHNAETGDQNWFANTAQYDGFTPAVDDDYVYAFITDFAAYDRVTGELAYTIDFPNFNWRGYDVDMATVLTGLGNSVAIQQGTLVVFDLEQRAILWERSGSYVGQPSSHLGQIFALESGILKVIDEPTGDTLWSYEASESLTSNIVITRTHVFVGGGTTTFAIDLESQETVWSYTASGDLSLSDEGVLYISGHELTAIDLLPE